jgi:Rrf2 family nitric oxide-sensitive transcriptional repressor
MAKLINLTESTLIALHSLILIVKKTPDKISSRFIAKAIGASENTIAKVMQRLVKEKLVRSERGPYGGFTLNKPPGEISFMDIFEAIEGKLDTKTCPFNHDKCTFKKCIFGNYINKISGEMKEHFSNRTLLEYQ